MSTEEGAQSSSIEFTQLETDESKSEMRLVTCVFSAIPVQQLILNVSLSNPINTTQLFSLHS